MPTQNIPFNQIWGFRAEDNVSRPGTDVDSLYTSTADRLDNVISIATHDYIPARGGYITVFELNADKKKQALKEKSALLQSMIDQPETYEIKIDGTTHTLTPKAVLDNWRALFCDPKTKEPTEPKYGLVVGFRRFFSWHLTNALRSSLNKAALVELPCDIQKFKSAMDRHFMNIAENEKGEGFRKVSENERVSAAMHLFRDGANENKMREKWKAGTGQKLFAICKLADRCPELNLIERFINPVPETEPDPDHPGKRRFVVGPDGKAVYKPVINYGSLDRETLRSMSKDTNLDCAAVEDYVNNPKAGKPDTQLPGAAPTAKIESKAQSGVLLVRYTLNAVRYNNLDSLNVFNPFAEELNEIFKRIEAESPGMHDFETDRANYEAIKANRQAANKAAAAANEAIPAADED